MVVVSRLAKEPDLSVKELVIRTGAPFDMCNFMRRRVKEEREKLRALHEARALG